MGSLLSYSLYSSIVLSLLYLTYKWMMSGENYFRFNRLVLWAIYIVSLLSFPLARFAAEVTSPAQVVIAPEIELGGIMAVIAEDEPADSVGSLFTILLYIYIGGIIVASAHTLWIFSRLIRIVSKAETVETGRYKVLVTDDTTIAPFSWWRYIVMSRTDWEESGRMISIHECQHLALHHWIDLLVAQLVGIFQWYNPAAWLMREELKTVHEYQADNAVIESGVAARDYQMLLIKKAVGARFPSLANSLNHSKLKKRITMMYKSNSSASRRLRGLALVPALAVAVTVVNLDAVASVLTDISDAEINVGKVFDDKVTQNVAESQTSVFTESSAESVESSVDAVAAAATEAAVAETIAVGESETAAEPQAESQQPAAAAQNDDDDQVMKIVEVKPEFPGGDAALMNYLSEHVKYPKEAFEKKIQGRVVVQFVIKKDGSIGEVKLIRAVDEALDAEAVRVVKSLPNFTPGLCNGKPVSVWYTIPVTFRLSGKDDAQAATQNSSAPVSVKNESGDAKIRIDGAQSKDSDKTRFEYYVNGKLFDGSLEDLEPQKIKSITINKNNPDIVKVMIEVK